MHPERLNCMHRTYMVRCIVGPAEVQQKIFLSAATLLVVPPALVQHWLFQVQEHVRFNALKVLVISSDKDRSNKIPMIHSLAWDYDLVSLLLSSLQM